MKLAALCSIALAAFAGAAAIASPEPLEKRLIIGLFH